MRRKSYIFVILFLLIIASFSVSIASKESKADELVLQKVSSGQRVGVIVELNEPLTLRTASKGEALKIQQEDVISKLESSSIGHKYSIINGFSASISPEDLTILEKDPRVKRVSYDTPLQVSLNEVRTQINATETHLLQLTNGQTLTGHGQTICVIDTGINYNHASLGSGWGNKVIGGYRSLYQGGDIQECNQNNSACLDDHNHGSHVSGIAAGNGAVKGIAPDAKLIAIKTMESGGGGWSSDTIRGIEWCVSNASKYNITIISMSLGGQQFSNYCDNTSTLTTAVNLAIANNISIVAATGNTGGSYLNATAGISEPACIANSTRVSSVGTDADQSADVLSSFAFRHQNFPDILLAPGKSVTSAVKSGGTGTMSGTSMATPVISGVMAVLKQFDNTLTPAELEAIIKGTGKSVNDSSGTMANFSRVLMLDAVYSLNTAPNITSYLPTNLTINVTNNGTYVFNITFTSEDIPAPIWYLNGAQVSSGNNYSFVQDSTKGGNYSLEVIALDRLSLNNDSQSWLLLSDIPPEVNDAPNITAFSPTNTTPTVEQFATQTFSITASDADAGDNLTYKWYNNGALISGADTNSYDFTATYLDIGDFTLLANVTDDQNASDVQTWTVTVTSRGSTGSTPSGADNVTGLPSGATPTTLQNVTFYNGAQPLLEFEFNFSANLLDLDNITITRGTNVGNGYTLINGVPLQGNLEKTAYVQIVDNSSKVCVRDTTVSAPSEFSSDCDDDDNEEYIVTCDGTVQAGGYVCTEVNGYYKVENLEHSGVIEYEESSSPPPADPDPDSPAGSGSNSNSNTDNSNSSNTTETATPEPLVSLSLAAKVTDADLEEYEDMVASTEEVENFAPATGWASKFSTIFGPVADIKWSTWIIVSGIIVAASIASVFLYKRKFGKIGKKLERDFEGSLHKWQDRRKRKGGPGIFANIKAAFKSIGGRLKNLKFKRK